MSVDNLALLSEGGLKLEVEVDRRGGLDSHGGLDYLVVPVGELRARLEVVTLTGVLDVEPQVLHTGDRGGQVEVTHD